MADGRFPSSGDVVAARYELMEQVSERLGATTWRARDRVLERNVGIEALASDDPRAASFVAAARASTVVVDPRFLRVLDVLDDDAGFAVVVREWARAFPLDQLLRHGTLPNHRAAVVVAEVARALANAHEQGQHHRRLTPGQVLVKQSGAVRIVGLGVAHALAPGPDVREDGRDPEREDVRDLGRLLYACLAARWPGGPADGLRAAPTDHGHVLRPRQVVAGVSRDVDDVCDRILGDPPRHGSRPLRTALEVAHQLQRVGDGEELDDPPSMSHLDGSDLLRIDPVVVPSGPPPGLEPPRRRPKAYAPKPPTAWQRARARARLMTKGDRALVLLGLVGALALAGLLGWVAAQVDGDDGGYEPPSASEISRLSVDRVTAIDPEGTDGDENSAQAPLAVDGSLDTAWRTSEYFGSPDFAGLKDGVGLVLDLGAQHELTSVEVTVPGPTSLAVYTSSTLERRPRSPVGMRLVATQRDAEGRVRLALGEQVLSRYVVVWISRVPQVRPGVFQGQVQEVVVRGRP
jgi:putative peptidoglycan lipid II flippase